MRKIKLAFIPLLCLTLLLTGCGKDKEETPSEVVPPAPVEKAAPVAALKPLENTLSDTMNRYENKAAGYALPYPDSMTIRESSGYNVAFDTRRNADTPSPYGQNTTLHLRFVDHRKLGIETTGQIKNYINEDHSYISFFHKDLPNKELHLPRRFDQIEVIAKDDFATLSQVTCQQMKNFPITEGLNEVVINAPKLFAENYYILTDDLAMVATLITDLDDQEKAEKLADYMLSNLEVIDQSEDLSLTQTTKGPLETTFPLPEGYGQRQVKVNGAKEAYFYAASDNKYAYRDVQLYALSGQASDILPNPASGKSPVLENLARKCYLPDVIEPQSVQTFTNLMGEPMETPEDADYTEYLFITNGTHVFNRAAWPKDRPAFDQYMCIALVRIKDGQAHAILVAYPEPVQDLATGILRNINKEWTL